MVQTSGIREKFRSEALNQLIKERGTKRTRKDLKQESDISDSDEDLKLKESKVESDSRLLSILPKPKNGNVFGPTIKLKDLLVVPERAKNYTNHAEDDDSHQRYEVDGTVEFNVNDVLSDPASSNILKPDDTGPKVVIPKGKEKQKNQITYLAQLSKATEMERKEQAAQGRFNKKAARAKYGW